MPALKALVERLADKPFQMIGVDTNDSREDYAAGVKKHGLSWLVAYQGDETPIADLYRVQAYPSIFILGPDGKIAARDLRGEKLAKKVDELLAQMQTQ